MDGIISFHHSDKTTEKRGRKLRWVQTQNQNSSTGYLSINLNVVGGIYSGFENMYMIIIKQYIKQSLIVCDRPILIQIYIAF